MAVVERLGSIQFDSVDVAGRNHDLVLLARVSGYRRDMTDTLLYDERRLFEAYNKGLSLLPTTSCRGPPDLGPRARGSTARASSSSTPGRRRAVGRITAEGPRADRLNRDRRSSGTGGRRTRCGLLEGLEAGVLASCDATTASTTT
jgi:uncharacterized protein YcaQ